MSVRVMSWVWEHSVSVGAERLVLLAIADAANDTGREAYPGMATIAKKANVDRRTAQRAVHALVKAGELSVQENAGPHGTHRYAVIMGRRVATGGEMPQRQDTAPTDRPELDVNWTERGGEMPPVAGHRRGTVPPEPSTKNKNSIGAKPRRERPPDPIWDALVAACHIDTNQLTTTARGATNRAVAELRAVQATPDQIGQRASAYRRTYPNASLTPTALVKHWAQLNGHKPPAAPYHQEWPT